MVLKGGAERCVVTGGLGVGGGREERGEETWTRGYYGLYLSPSRGSHVIKGLNVNARYQMM